MAGILVRDNIPDMIRTSGQTVQTRTATNEERWELLVQKLRSVVEELADMPGANSLAEVQEVLLAMTHELSLSPADVDEARVIARDNMGGYAGATVLVEVEPRR